MTAVQLPLAAADLDLAHDIALEAVARHDHPATSTQAAASVRRLGESRAAVLALLLTGPMTDGQLWEAYQREWVLRRWPRQSVSGVRTRRHELVAAGLVRDTGRTGVTESGRAAVIWEAA